MAFYNRIGSIMRQTNGHVSMPSMFNAIRCMSSSSFSLESLRDAFASFGDVSEARVITDRDTGRSRGFGFVSFCDTESASSALSAMDGQQLNGRNIRVSYATDRPPRNNFAQGGGYGSGYNDGGANDGF